jgi:hypothetical protein
MQRIDKNKYLLPTVGSVHSRVEKFSQGRSKVADDARPGRPVEIATEETVQRVKELIRELTGG